MSQKEGLPPESLTWRVITAIGRVALPLGGVIAVIGFLLVEVAHIDAGANLYIVTLALFLIKVPALFHENNRTTQAAAIRNRAEQERLRAEVAQMVVQQAQAEQTREDNNR